MTTVQEADEKMEEFWRYIDNCRVLESLTEAFKELCNEPDKPRDILEYLKDKLGDKNPPEGTPYSLRKLLREAKAHIKKLEEEIRFAKEEKKGREKTIKMYKQKKKDMSWKDAAICADKMGLHLTSEKNHLKKHHSTATVERRKQIY